MTIIQDTKYILTNFLVAFFTLCLHPLSIYIFFQLPIENPSKTQAAICFFVIYLVLLLALRLLLRDKDTIPVIAVASIPLLCLCFLSMAVSVESYKREVVPIDWTGSSGFLACLFPYQAPFFTPSINLQKEVFLSSRNRQILWVPPARVGRFLSE